MYSFIENRTTDITFHNQKRFSFVFFLFLLFLVCRLTTLSVQRLYNGRLYTSLNIHHKIKRLK
jgi:hypothetical protein